MTGKSPWVRPARLALAVIVAILLGFGFSRIDRPLNIDTNLKSLSPALSSDPALQDAVNSLSTSLESRLVILVKGKDTADTRAAVKALAAMLGKQEGVQITMGDSFSEPLLELFANHRFTLLDPDQRTLLENQDTKQIVSAATNRLYQIADSGRALPFEQDPLGWFTDYLAGVNEENRNGDGHPSDATIYLNLGEQALDHGFQKTFSARMQQAEVTLATEYPGVQVLKSGIFLFAEQAARSARRDITLISSLSSIAVIGLILLAFHSLGPILLALLSVAAGIGFAFVISHLLFGNVHILTLVFGAGLIGIVIDYALHYGYHQTWDRSGTDRDYNALLRAMLLGLGSSVIGYGALSLSSLPALGRVAVFSCLGLCAAWICVIALGPVLGRGNSRHHSVAIEGATNVVLTLARKLATRPALPVTLIIAGLIGLGFGGIKVNDDSRTLFHPDPALVEQERQVAELTRNLEPGQYFIVRGNTIDELYEGIALLEQKAPADQLLSIANILPSPARQKTNYALQHQLYQAGGAVPAFLANLGADPAIAENLLGEYLALEGEVIDPLLLSRASGNQLPPLVRPHDGSLFGFVLIRERSGLEPAITLAGTSPDITFIDTAGMTSRELARQRHSALWILLVGYGLIGLLLLLRYRKLSALGMLLVPATSTLAILCVFSLFGTGLTLFHTMALFLVLGLGMDYTIFRIDLGGKLSITCQAVFLSALTSLLSFGLLAWSSMPLVQAFGVTLLVGNLFNLIGALVYGEIVGRVRWLKPDKPETT